MGGLTGRHVATGDPLLRQRRRPSARYRGCRPYRYRARNSFEGRQVGNRRFTTHGDGDSLGHGCLGHGWVQFAGANKRGQTSDLLVYVLRRCRCRWVFHPGEVLTVHWIVQPGAPTSATQRNEVKLSAGLTGPYADVSSLKQHGGTKTPSISAPLFVTSDVAGGTPSSRLLIPENAAPGFYDLSTASRSGGLTSGGGGIIRVAAR